MGIRRLIAVDPGKNTGVCSAAPMTDSLEWKLWSGEPYEAINRVFSFVRYAGPRTAIVVERFTVTNTHHTRQYDALEVIGALRWIARRESVSVFELQARADRLRIQTNIARRFGRPTDDDQMSALKHALFAAARHGLVDPITFYVTIDR